MLTNTQILLFIQGYQGGTIHQLAGSLAKQFKLELENDKQWAIQLFPLINRSFIGLHGTDFTDIILDADDNMMQELARLAQREYKTRQAKEYSS